MIQNALTIKEVTDSTIVDVDIKELENFKFSKEDVKNFFEPMLNKPEIGRKGDNRMYYWFNDDIMIYFNYNTRTLRAVDYESENYFAILNNSVYFSSCFVPVGNLVDLLKNTKIYKCLLEQDRKTKKNTQSIFDADCRKKDFQKVFLPADLEILREEAWEQLADELNNMIPNFVESILKAHKLIAEDEYLF